MNINTKLEISFLKNGMYLSPQGIWTSPPFGQRIISAGTRKEVQVIRAALINQCDQISYTYESVSKDRSSSVTIHWLDEDIHYMKFKDGKEIETGITSVFPFHYKLLGGSKWKFC